jgi:galactose mutarotase-like enzyme
MATKQWTLLDQNQNLPLADRVIRPEDVGGSAAGYSVVQRTLSGGLSTGVTAIRVDNGVFAWELLPTRGLGIWKAWLGSEEIGWRSPIRGPVHPMFVPIAEPSGLGWLDGFDELLVRCGLESNGAPDFDPQGRLTFPLHGRIANRPAHLVRLSIDGDSGEITLTGEVEENRFHFLKLRLVTTISSRVGEAGFRMTDRVVNLSQSPAEFQLLYHVNFGQPLLDAGARVVVPAHTVVPRNARAAEGIASWDSYPAEQPGYAEQVYFLKLLADENDMSQVLLKNAHATRGVSLRFNTSQLPYFTIWKNTTAAADGCVTGLEPGTNFPNPRCYEGNQGRVVKLAPGGSTSFTLEFQVHGDSKSVASAEAAIAKLRGSVEPKIHDHPQPGWCAE